jgi:hypothetical protein
MWTSAIYLLLGSALWRARTAVIVEKTWPEGT